MRSAGVNLPCNKTRADWGKIFLDLMLTVPALIVLTPVMAVIALFVWLKIGSPIIFRQKRPGLYGKSFTIYKFRTMTDARDAQGNLFPYNQHTTRLGKFLRKTSLDELLELWNVLKGDMSLVGPRPLLMEYLPLYNNFQKRRHEVRPGITGWAQVNGRNAITWEQKFKYDVWYVDHLSFSVDLKIILLTIKKVLFRKDINKSEKITMEPFKGSGN